MPKMCTEDGCTAVVYGGGLCASHYTRAFREGYRSDGQKAEACSVAGCSRPVRSKGMCGSHYNKTRRWGTPEPPPKPKPVHKKRSPGGYVAVKVPEGHPMAMANGYAMEHRLVMSNALGRPLEKFENVHHINGVRDDNRPENLELWNTYQPSGQRIDDKIAWAVEILRLYRPEALA